MKKIPAYYIDKTVRYLFFTLILLIPFHTGATVRYCLAGFMDLLCIVLFWGTDGQLRRRINTRAKKIISQPLFWTILLFTASALLSIAFSPDPSRSTRAFGEEFFLNFITFFLLALYAIEFGEKTDWFSGLLIVNAIFLAVYLGVMLQWFSGGKDMWFVESDILKPGVLWWLPPDKTLIEASGVDRVLSYGDGNTIFNGIKHTSLFLTLFIGVATVTVAVKKHLYPSLILFFVNILTLVSTTKRSVMAAATMGVICSLFFFNYMKKFIAAGIIILLIVVLIILESDKNKYLVRENWDLMLKGKISEAVKKGGSIPLRMCAYKEFAADVAANPFMGIGPARKNIRVAYPETVDKCHLVHAHNTFLNMALYTGVQGMLSLICIIFFQFSMLLHCWKNSIIAGDRQLSAAIILFMIMFWGSNMFMDGFRHGSALLYWMVTAVAAGRALSEVNPKITV